MDIIETAYTINKQGLTFVPIEFYIVNRDIKVIIKDAYYTALGKEEAQKFN